MGFIEEKGFNIERGKRRGWAEPTRALILAGDRLLSISMQRSIWVRGGRASWRKGPNCSVGDDGVVRIKAWGKPTGSHLRMLITTVVLRRVGRGPGAPQGENE